MNHEYEMSCSTTSWMENGIVTIHDGRIFLCEWPIIEFFKQFEGKHIEIAIHPCASEYKIDSLIAPLVSALQSKGIDTVSSCQGHLGSDWLKPYPWVATKSEFYDTAFELFDFECVPEQYGLFTIKSRHKALDEKDLALLQESAIELARALSQ